MCPHIPSKQGKHRQSSIFDINLQTLGYPKTYKQGKIFLKLLVLSPKKNPEAIHLILMFLATTEQGLRKQREKDLAAVRASYAQLVSQELKLKASPRAIVKQRDLLQADLERVLVAVQEGAMAAASDEAKEPFRWVQSPFQAVN